MNKYAYLDQQLQLLDDLRLEFYWRTHEAEETQMIGRRLITMFETSELNVTLDIDLDDPSMTVMLVKIDQNQLSVVLESEESLNKARMILEQIKNYYPAENDTDAVIVASSQQ